MMNFDDKQRLMGLLPEFLLLAQPCDAARIRGAGAIDASASAQVLDAAEAGLDRKEIFYSAPEKDDIVSTLGKCRIVANSMEELTAINAAAATAGVMTMVGLRLTNLGFSGSAMTTAQLRGLVHDIKQLKNISVCGCFVTGDVAGLHGKALGKYVRASYQTAKDMTYILPCSMPYIVIEGLLEAAAQNETEHPEDFQDFLTAANIVGMQNATAFYADYYVA